MESKNERKIYISLLLVLCLISLGLGYVLFKMSNSKEVRQVPVSNSITLNAVPLIAKDVEIKNSYVGYAEPIHQVHITPYISGYLQTVRVKKGETVKENDLLITIEPSEYKAKLEAAEAAVLQAKASFEYNKNYYDRVQKSGKKAFSEIETDNAKNNFLQAEAALKNAEANKAAAEVNFRYTTIKAPISGLVGNFDLSTGDYVAPNGGTLLSIVQIDPIRVVFSLTDVEYLNMKKDGEKLFKDSVINLKTANGEVFEHNGEFKYTDNTLNKATNSLPVYAYFKNEKNKLLPNSYVTVEVYKTFKNSVVIDKNFINMQADGSFITIARQNRLMNIKIDILGSKNNQYILKNTFMAGDLLVLDNTANIDTKAALHFNIQK